MDDLISRREAIEWCLEGLNNMPSAQPSYTEEQIQTMQELESAEIEKAYELGRESAQQQWIPCSERLPEEERRQYWICTDTGYQCQCRWTDDVYGLGVSDRWEWKIFDIPQYQKVVAWMPLPEAYKGEQP